MLLEINTLKGMLDRQPNSNDVDNTDISNSELKMMTKDNTIVDNENDKNTPRQHKKLCGTATRWTRYSYISRK